MVELSSLVGQILDGKYRLEEKLGQGGMGAVFRATHLGTDRVVALKLIAPALADQEEFQARFQQEARATGRLRHPNIVDLTDFGFAEIEGRKVAYLVMEFLEGSSLTQVLEAEACLPLPWASDLIGQLCSALQAAHDKGILHRDLKPDNLWLVPNGQGGFLLKILDFGLAKLYDPMERRKELEAVIDQDSLETQAYRNLQTPRIKPAISGNGLFTEVGTILGTPTYMSPEQCRSARNMDQRSDLYSVGVILFQMLTGQTPFKGDSLMLMDKHLQSAPPDIAKLRPDIKPKFAALVQACLAKDPDQRPTSAANLAVRLDLAIMGQWELFARALGGCVRNPGLDLWLSLQNYWPTILGILLCMFLRFTGGGISSHMFPNNPKEAAASMAVGLVVLWLGVLVLLLLGSYRLICQTSLKLFLQRCLPQRALRIQDFQANAAIQEVQDHVTRKLLAMLKHWLAIPIGIWILGSLLAWQVPFRSPKSILIAAVILGTVYSLAAVGRDVYRFSRMPMGLKSDGRVFEELLTTEELVAFDALHHRRGLARSGMAEALGSLFALVQIYALLGFLVYGNLGTKPSLPATLGTLLASLLYFLVSPLLYSWMAEATFEDMREAGLDVRAILVRLRQRFFPGRTWFDRQA